MLNSLIINHNLKFDVIDSWNNRKFKDIVEKRNEHSNDKNKLKIEFSDVISGIGLLNSNLSKNESESNGTLFYDGDILFGKLRPYLKNWWLSNNSGIALGDFWVFNSLDNYNKFIYFLIQSKKFNKIANISTGTKMPRSDWKTVSNSYFEIPSFETQNKIGNYMFNLFSIREKIRIKIKNLKLFKKYLMQNMFI